MNKSRTVLIRFTFTIFSITTVTPVTAKSQLSETSTPPPRFDVVSIRMMKSSDDIPTHISNPSRVGAFRAVNVNLKALLEVAYDIPDLRIYGGPEWVNREHWFVEAKTDPTDDDKFAAISPEDGKRIKRQMLIALLTDRFALRVHTAARDMPVFFLVTAKNGVTLRDHLVPSADTSGSDRITVPPGHDSLAILAYELSWRLGKPVIDRTGLQWNRKIVLSWQEDDATTEGSGTSLFTAMREQLGLKLQSSRAPVPALLIDSVSIPTAN